MIRSLIFLLLTSAFCLPPCSLKGWQTSDLKSVENNWFKVSSAEYRLESLFADATIITYFKKGNTNSKIFPEYVPIKQKFIYHPTGQRFNSEEVKPKVWSDGVTGYRFYYSNVNLTTKLNVNCDSIMTTIDESFSSRIGSRYTLYHIINK